jgi:hypothetical protein
MQVPVGQKKCHVIPDPDRAKCPHVNLVLPRVTFRLSGGQVMRGKSRYIFIDISQMTMTRNLTLFKKYSVIPTIVPASESHNVFLSCHYTHCESTTVREAIFSLLKNYRIILARNCVIAQLCVSLQENLRRAA